MRHRHGTAPRSSQDGCRGRRRSSARTGRNRAASSVREFELDGQALGIGIGRIAESDIGKRHHVLTLQRHPRDSLLLSARTAVPALLRRTVRSALPAHDLAHRRSARYAVDGPRKVERLLHLPEFIVLIRGEQSGWSPRSDPADGDSRLRSPMCRGKSGQPRRTAFSMMTTSAPTTIGPRAPLSTAP